MGKKIWRDILGYKGVYQINDLAFVKSLKRPRGKRDKIISSCVAQTGYKTVVLFKNSVRKIYLLHRLIAMAFIPNPENKPCINHKDGNKLNNSLDNLEWCTRAENNQHAFRNGLINKSGEKCNLSKLKSYQVLEIRKLLKKYKQKDIARKFHIDQSTVSYIKTKRLWAHL